MTCTEAIPADVILLYCINTLSYKLVLIQNCIGAVMVNLVASSVVAHGFSGWVKSDHKIGICCFSDNNTALNEKEQKLVDSESE